MKDLDDVIKRLEEIRKDGQGDINILKAVYILAKELEMLNAHVNEVNRSFNKLINKGNETACSN